MDEGMKPRDTENSVALTLYVYSFGFKYGGPPKDDSGHGGGFTFDCRALPNPFWVEELKPFSGKTPQIAAFMEAKPEILAFADHALKLVEYSAQVYRELGRERLMVSFGCTGGRHRSVYQAERMAKSLEALGYRVSLDHLHIDHDGSKP